MLSKLPDSRRNKIMMGSVITIKSLLECLLDYNHLFGFNFWEQDKVSNGYYMLSQSITEREPANGI